MLFIGSSHGVAYREGSPWRSRQERRYFPYFRYRHREATGTPSAVPIKIAVGQLPEPASSPASTTRRPIAIGDARYQSGRGLTNAADSGADTPGVPAANDASAAG